VSGKPQEHKEREEREEDDELEGRLGEDPFEGLDTAWLNRDRGEMSIEVLGHDPFEGMDVDWLDADGDRFVAVSAAAGVRPTSPDTEREPPREIPAATEIDDFASSQPEMDEVHPEPEPVGAPELLVYTAESHPFELMGATATAQAEVPSPRATFYFPEDFKWGVAVSAHQVEGNNTNNDWWAWEQEVDHVSHGHRSGLACDWWHNAEADFDRAASLGVNAMRLSIEWSRVEPRPDNFDEVALHRYAQMLRGLRSRNIEPMVTLHHYTNPLWLAESGGWENPETVARFARFARRAVEALGDTCDLWCTINGPNLYALLSHAYGEFPPGRSEFKVAVAVVRNLLAAHAAAYREIHAVQSHARVGLAHNMRVFDPVDPESKRDRRAARFADRFYNQAIPAALVKGRWIPPLGIGPAWRLGRTLDWIGLNYYTRDLVAYDRGEHGPQPIRRTHAEGAEMLDGDTGEFYPQGIARFIRRLAKFGLPIYITGNGIPDEDDDQRSRYILSHLHQVWRMIQLSYPVMGYYHWSLVDGFEWNRGWALRFGLLAMNPKTQVRTPRRSAALYACVVEESAITPEIIDTYAPGLRSDLLPGRALAR
jgi:beta-glucosidase